MILDNEQQRQILIAALTQAPFAGASKLMVGAVEQQVRQAPIAAPRETEPVANPEE
jgi:hypothetical protein